jgi:metal-dependent amidase/aminoacylase/carboxypeptidase family protein
VDRCDAGKAHARLGLAVQEGIGGTGVLAMLEGTKPGKTLLIRADMDAGHFVLETHGSEATDLIHSFLVRKVVSDKE